MVASLNVGCHVEGNNESFLTILSPGGTQRKRKKKECIKGMILEGESTCL